MEILKKILSSNDITIDCVVKESLPAHNKISETTCDLQFITEALQFWQVIQDIKNDSVFSKVLVTKDELCIQCPQQNGSNLKYYLIQDKNIQNDQYPCQYIVFIRR